MVTNYLVERALVAVSDYEVAYLVRSSSSTSRRFVEAENVETEDHFFRPNVRVLVKD